MNTAILATGWYVVNSGETTLNLTVNGDVKLILANGCTLTANGIGPNADIGVFAGNTLTRYGQTTDTGTVEAIGDGGGWFLREQTPYDSIGVCMYDARRRKNEYGIPEKPKGFWVKMGKGETQMKRKRFLSILICAFMVLTLLPTGAQAAVNGGVFEYANPNSSLQSWIETDLQAAPFSQTPGSYDYSVVTSLKITGTMAVTMADADYTFIKNSLQSLVTLDISGVTGSFPSYAFQNCASIETVRLPVGTAISYGMFEGCSGLKTLGVGSAALTDGVIDLSGYTAASFGMVAFVGCTGIEAVRLPAAVAISNGMFEGCSGLKTLGVGSAAFTDGVIDLSGYTAASFGMAAFLGCAGIEAVRLPASTAISLNMFNGCSSLKTLGVGSGALTGGLVDLSGYTAASFGLGPFGGCASIEKVRLPAGTAISGSMFNGCSSLKTLGVGSAALTDGVIDLSGYTAASFGMAAFLGCAGIEAVRLPASTAISLNMFYGCSGLATAVFAGNTAPAIGTNAFLNVKCVAYVPDRDSGGYEAAVFTQHFSEVRSIALPAFSAVPQSQTKTEGQAASFSVTVTPGEPAPYTFKWQVSADAGASWSDIAGETGNTLNLGAVSLLQNDCRFRCVAASLVGGTASVAATLTVNAIVDAAQPSIAVQPQSSAVTADQEITLSVTATSPDGGALSYQWCKDGSAVPGATNADYKPDTGMTGTHVYYVVVTNTNNSATGSKTAIRQSDSATVTVNDAYIPRMLTDSATGISVSGMIRRYAALTVNDMTLGDDPACNTIRQRMNDDDYALLLGKEISLSQGFTGTLTITMPVGAQYNGQTVTILHCTGGTLETYTATVTDGKAVFSVTSLSPFAVFALAPVAPDIDPPTVVTTSVTDVSATGVKLNSRVVADGGAAVTESGFIYGTVSNPVIGGACVTKVTAGSGTGSFSAALTGLEPDTAYYVRAYAINNEGTSYGAAISFRTDEDDLDDIPKTGDSSSPGVWWLLCGVSAAGIVTLIVLGKWKKAYKR